MSMEISTANNIYQENYTKKTEAGLKKELEPKTMQNVTSQKDIIPMPEDEYISSETSGAAPSGLYRLGQDENGNPKILFDDPNAAKKSPEKTPGTNSKTPENSEETCTANTDKVDQEIKKLKEEKKQLEQQLKAALGNDKKTETLNKKIAAIENELRQKDNDAYRRQHAVIS